jgi:hypothetical protein
MGFHVGNRPNLNTLYGGATGGTGSTYTSLPFTGFQSTGNSYTVLTATEAAAYLADIDLFYKANSFNFDSYDTNFNRVTASVFSTAGFRVIEGAAYDPTRQTFAYTDQSSNIYFADQNGFPKAPNTVNIPGQSLNAIGYSPVRDEWFIHARGTENLYIYSGADPSLRLRSFVVDTGDVVAGFYGPDGIINLFEYGTSAGVRRIDPDTGTQTDFDWPVAPQSGIRGATVNPLTGLVHIWSGTAVSEYQY